MSETDTPPTDRDRIPTIATRRRVLASLGATGGALLAGCVGNGGGTEDGDEVSQTGGTDTSDADTGSNGRNSGAAGDEDAAGDHDDAGETDGDEDKDGEPDDSEPVSSDRVIADLLAGPVTGVIADDIRTLSDADLSVTAATPAVDGSYAATIATPIGTVEYAKEPDGESAIVFLDPAALDAANGVSLTYQEDVILAVNGDSVEYISRVPDQAVASFIDRQYSIVRKEFGQVTPETLAVSAYELDREDVYVTVVRSPGGDRALGIRASRAGAQVGQPTTVQVVTGVRPWISVGDWVSDAANAAWDRLADALAKVLDAIGYPEHFEDWSTCWACCINEHTDFIKDSDLSVQELQDRFEEHVSGADSRTEAAQEILDVIKELAEAAGLGVLEIVRLVSTLVTCAWDCNPPGDTDEGC